MVSASRGSMSFDRIAPHYRWMEFVLAGEKLQRCRTAFLDLVGAPKDVLILGEGHGRFLLECRRRIPSALITCVDSSERMLAVARQRLKRTGLPEERVRFVHADALSWNGSAAAADLLVTQFFLDCFRADQLGPLVARLASLSKPEAAWLVADFQAPAGGIPRLRACLLLNAMYAFFRTVTRLPASHLTNPDSFIQRHGFTLRKRIESEWGLLRSDLWTR
jgi:ubiquinone/menaquinone biosynthesis C-methylase UbiE